MNGSPANWTMINPTLYGIQDVRVVSFIKIILNIIFELCQHLGSLRSLWKAPETETFNFTNKIASFKI